jgi:E3 ubiquitin-protein ligase HOS1
VSSDPLLAFLLDEVVIKDWCKRAVNALISEIGMICIQQCSIVLSSVTYLTFFLISVRSSCVHGPRF